MTGTKTKRGPSERAKRPTRSSAGASFSCFQCGAKVSYDSDRCPKCRSSYIKGLKEEDVDELLKAEKALDEPFVDFVEAHGSTVVHFDADISMMNLLDDEGADPGFVSECSNCGTVVEINTSRCPMCGSALEHLNVGLVDMFADMEFDPQPSEDADCPYCGEHVTLRSGDCPSCGKTVGFKDAHDPALKVSPVLKARDVVFLHLDIATGEIDILKRNTARHCYDQMSLHLNGAGNGEAAKGRSGLSRG